MNECLCGSQRLGNVQVNGRDPPASCQGRGRTQDAPSNVPLQDPKSFGVMLEEILSRTGEYLLIKVTFLWLL